MEKSVFPPWDPQIITHWLRCYCLNMLSIGGKDPRDRIEEKVDPVQTPSFPNSSFSHHPCLSPVPQCGLPWVSCSSLGTTASSTWHFVLWLPVDLAIFPTELWVLETRMESCSLWCPQHLAHGLVYKWGSVITDCLNEFTKRSLRKVSASLHDHLSWSFCLSRLMFAEYLLCARSCTCWDLGSLYKGGAKEVLIAILLLWFPSGVGVGCHEVTICLE